ncbi:MAG: Archaeal histone A (modular protein) [Promethearchaeota archaeon]|nr:MAG: Archaeal histone A (modular protein) [Candidatus Lokiarchaeota archaeon]
MAKKKTSTPNKTPAKKSGDSYMAKAPIRRLMKKVGADLVAAEALDQLIAFLEKTAIDTTKKAIKMCNADKRKRVMGSDIRKASARI